MLLFWLNTCIILDSKWETIVDLGPCSPGKWGAWDLLRELLHELPQSHCGDNGNGTLFLGVHICYSNFVCIGLKHSLSLYIYIYNFCSFVALVFLMFKVYYTNNYFSYISVFLEKQLCRKWNERFVYKSQVHFLV